MRTGATRVEPGWLALRGPADGRARSESAGGLADDLARFLRARRPAGPAALVDVGAGTGAGATWLRPRLGLPQRWRLIDHDAELLAGAAPVAAGWARPVVADLACLARLLADQPADAVTWQALLDLLPASDIHSLLAPAISSRAAVLAGLTVTGGVRLSPPHPDDARIAAAFDAHQRRAGRLGPDAGGFAADTLHEHGYTVTAVATPWRLAARDVALTGEWLRGRSAAALEQSPADAQRIERWLAARLSVADRGELTAVVDHVDVLGIPSPA